MQSVTLVVAVLTRESSYEPPLEREASEVSDSVQWWIAPDATWRIRTFAINHDIHPYAIGRISGDRASFAIENTKKHFGDILRSLHVVELSNPSDIAKTGDELAKAGLKGGHLEIGKSGFGFWNPDGATYRTQSSPK